MNYRHAYHAGNFADVVKHWVVSRILQHLKLKDAAFFCLDTHAGAGSYDLTHEEPGRTGEWRSGIGRLLAATPPAETASLLATYLEVVRALQPAGAKQLTAYPGSPELMLRLMRRRDMLSLCELHPDDARLLQRRYQDEPRVRVNAGDGWKALLAQVPPAQRRGLVLIDPPFERPDEFETMADRLLAAHRRWDKGCYVLWYPGKDSSKVRVFHNRLSTSGIRKVLQMGLHVDDGSTAPGLSACGLIVVNPPWTFEQEARSVLPFLAETLAQSTNAGWNCCWLVPE